VIKAITIVACLICCSITYSHAQELTSPDTVTIPSGKLMLKGLLWHPAGTGSFPTIIFCHGSYESYDTRYDVIQQTSVLGPLFAKNGYLFLGLFRRGVGISKDQGKNSADLIANAFKEKGQEERNKVQMRQLQTDDLQDMISGLAFLRQRSDVDTNHIAVIGHSFGGSLALMVAEQDPGLKAVVVFGTAGYSWNLSSQLRTGLYNAIKNINAPVMIVHAQNDYSVTPGYALDSMLNILDKPHLLKIYPAFGNSKTEGHNILFLSTDSWETDVLRFLHKAFDD
jgi:carboxymethylenebutenolidase